MNEYAIILSYNENDEKSVTYFNGTLNDAIARAQDDCRMAAADDYLVAQVKSYGEASSF